MKRSIALGAIATLALGLAACSSQDSSGSDKAADESGRTCVTKITPAKATTTTDVPVKPVESDAVPAVTGGAEFGQKPTVAAGQGNPPTQLLRKTLIQGNGAEVKSGSNVVVNYLGQLWDGTVFDNSYDRGQTFSFTVGSGVIDGWSYGLVGAKVGDRIELVIPPDLGYKEAGAGDKIPGNATLVFIVDVVFTPPQLTDSELAGFTDLLSKSTSVKADLPEGLRIFCKPGQEPQLGYVEGSQVPSKVYQAWTTEGKGQTIKKGDMVGYVGVAGSWGDTPQSTWTNGDGIQYAQADQLGAVGKKVGSRYVVVGPPTTQATRGVVQVWDIVSAQPAS